MVRNTQSAPVPLFNLFDRAPHAQRYVFWNDWFRPEPEVRRTDSMIYLKYKKC